MKYYIAKKKKKYFYTVLYVATWSHLRDKDNQKKPDTKHCMIHLYEDSTYMNLYEIS